MTRCDTDCSVTRVCAYFVREWFYQAIDSVNWRNSNTSGEHVENKGRHIDTAPRDTLEEVDGERDEEHNVQGCAALTRRPGTCNVALWFTDSENVLAMMYLGGKYATKHFEGCSPCFLALHESTLAATPCGRGSRWTVHSRHKVQQRYEKTEMHRPQYGRRIHVKSERSFLVGWLK